MSSAEVTEKDRFALPGWTGRPPHGCHLDVAKGDRLLQKLLIDEKGVYYFGRNPTQCDFVVEHASCSRVHSILLYHKALKRFALVDLGSSHGTFVEKTRVEPLKPIFLDFDTMFFFGASTRRYTLRNSLDIRDSHDDEADGTTLPQKQLELDNLTEYNTAQNRRIPQIPITIEEARKKSRARPRLKFTDEEDIINPEDVDPTVGRFRNMVRTAVIPQSSSAKRTRAAAVPDQLFDFYAPDAKKNAHHHVRSSFTGADNEVHQKLEYGPFNSTTLGGISLNAAPDLEVYAAPKQTPTTGFQSILKPSSGYILLLKKKIRKPTRRRNMPKKPGQEGRIFLVPCN
uniref:FHA domain-containing protein n=1 Tax=Ditylenchus dipsaci TaxID=166011 RepID=A0A915CLS9_9BILA